MCFIKFWKIIKFWNNVFASFSAYLSNFDFFFAYSYKIDFHFFPLRHSGWNFFLPHYKGLKKCPVFRPYFYETPFSQYFFFQNVCFNIKHHLLIAHNLITSSSTCISNFNLQTFIVLEILGCNKQTKRQTDIDVSPW